MSQPIAELCLRICQTSGAALIATDGDGRIIYWNPAATTLLGSDPEAMLGQPLTGIVPARNRQEFAELITRTIETDQATQFEMAVWMPPQGRTPVSATLGPLRDDAGESIGVVACLIDQSNSLQLAEQLAKNQKMASLGTLAGGVAHHFNNILGGVGTFVDFALTSGEPATMRRALQMTAEAVTRATRLTSTLLSFTEQDSGQQDLADFTEVLLTLTSLLEKRWAEKDIQLDLKLGDLPVVPVTTARIQRLLRCVLANAEEAMPDGGTVTIETARKQGHIVLQVRDTGAGIAAETMPHVLEPFFTTKGLLAGGHDDRHVGLGLSIAHAVVSDMGGRLTVHSTVGQGAEVRIVLPIQPVDDPAD